MTAPICGQRTHGGQVCILEPGHRGICTPSWDKETAKLDPTEAREATLAEAKKDIESELADCHDNLRQFAHGPETDRRYWEGRRTGLDLALTHLGPALAARDASGAGPGTPTQSMADGDDVTAAIELGAAEDDGAFCVYRRLPGFSTWSKVSPTRYATLQEAIDVAERMAAPTVPRPGAALGLAVETRKELAYIETDIERAHAVLAMEPLDHDAVQAGQYQGALNLLMSCAERLRAVLLHAAQQGGE